MVTRTTEERLTEQEVAAVLWAAVNKASSKEGDRDALSADVSRHVRLTVSGEVAGRPIHRSLRGTLTVGADQERAVSATPDQPTLIALILSKLNEATRDKILADLPQQFAVRGAWPEVSPGLVEAAEQMLCNIRSHKTIKVRGNVRFTYDVAAEHNRRATHSASTECRSAGRITALSRDPPLRSETPQGRLRMRAHCGNMSEPKINELLES